MLSIIPGIVYDMPITLEKQSYFREFPGDPLGRTQCLHCQGQGSIPGWGTKLSQATQSGLKRKKEKKVTVIKPCHEVRFSKCTYSHQPRKFTFT